MKYLKELLQTLKSIDESLKRISGCVRRSPGDWKYTDVINTAHWND